MAKKENMGNHWAWCCSNTNTGFPTFWAIVLVLAAVWFATDMGWISFNFPWLAAILVIVALGAIINHYNK